ncbi:MAG: hypothetical protein KGQ94_10040, partial [Alphaproteobacteria bacterium]|nr:hypothetical protein [Alphaproteobacteria bacterium]
AHLRHPLGGARHAVRVRWPHGQRAVSLDRSGDRPRDHPARLQEFFAKMRRGITKGFTSKKKDG